MSIDSKLFRNVMGTFATGVTVVTTQDDEKIPYAVTVSSFTSVSLDPPLVLVCLDNQLASLEAFLKSGRFAINILAHDQENFSNLSARRGSDRSECLTAVGSTGLPVMENPLALIECRLKKTFPGGDHKILLGEVVHLSLGPSLEESQPLLFYRGRYADLASV